MPSNPTRPDHSDRPSSSPATHFNQPHTHELPQQQQQQEQNLYYQQHSQHAPPDLPQSIRPLQPQLYTSTQLNVQAYTPFVYPQSTPSLPQNIQPSEEIMESDHDMKRMRVSRACDSCRRKKIKCDTDGLGSTCRGCSSTNMVCTFKDSAKKRGPPKGYIEVLENRLKRMEQLLGGIANDKTTATCPKQSNNDETVGANMDPAVADSSLSSSSLPSSSSSPPPSTNSAPSFSPTADRPTLVGISNSVMAKPTPPGGTNSEPSAIFGASSDTANRSSIAEIHPRYIADLSTLPFLAKKFNLEDDRVASSAGVEIRRFGQSLVMYEEGDSTTGRTPNQYVLEKLGLLEPGEPIMDVDDWILKVADISKATSNRLMKVYFAYIHPGLPVVNKTLFLNQYRGLANDYPPAPLLNAMYGAAVRYIETCRLYGDETTIIDALDNEVDDWQIPEGGSERLFDNLLKYVRGTYSPNIATIQALVIAQNHRASMEGKMTGGWLINSAAIRMAQDLGLHRSSEAWDISEDEKETRRRVWWAVYIMDKWSAASTGRPQTIFDEDCDESYPSESARWEEVLDIGPDFDDHHQPRFPSLDKSIAQKVKGERIPIYQPFVQLVKLSEILGRILQGLYTPRAKKHSAEHGSDAIVSYLDKALSDWRAALPPSLQISGKSFHKLDSRGRTPLLSMSGLMYLSYCTLLILLHRPFIEKEGGAQTKSSISSLSICTSAATRCVHVAASMHFRDFLLVSWNFAIYHVFTASLIHIHTAANSGSVVSDVAKDDLIKSVRVVKRLSNLSTSACRIHQVLLRLMKMGNIPYPDSLSEEENEDEDEVTQLHTGKEAVKTTLIATSTAGPSNGKKHSSRCKRANYDTNTLCEDDIPRTSLSSHMSDVGRGHAPPNPTKGPAGNTRSIPTPIQQQYDEAPSSANSTPTSLINGDWINGLYSSIQQDGSQASMTNINTHNEPDPHSLRQFGMNLGQMFTPIDQVNAITPSSNTLALDQQQPYNLTADDLSQAGFLGLSNFGFTSNSMQQQPLHSLQYPDPNLQPSQASSSPSPSLLQQDQQQNAHANNYMNPMPPPSRTVPSHPQMVDHSIFRNRPDNPFWSVPSSIEMDDWAAYLLPPGITSSHRSQQDEQNITQMQYQSHQQQQQQQQAWPSGWM